MKKVNVFLNINDYKLETIGFLDKNILKFKDKDELETDIIYDIDNDTLIRDNSDITIKMDFSKDVNNMEYTLKENNISFSDTFKKYSLNNSFGNIIIRYRVGENMFNLTLKYEEVK